MGAYDRPLSFRTMTTRLFVLPRLLRPSNAMPPVIEPSPITATTRRSMPFNATAVAMPCAYDSTVDAWLFSIQSCSDSSRFG